MVDYGRLSNPCHADGSGRIVSRRGMGPLRHFGISHRECGSSSVHGEMDTRNALPQRCITNALASVRGIRGHFAITGRGTLRRMRYNHSTFPSMRKDHGYATRDSACNVSPAGRIGNVTCERMRLVVVCAAVPQPTEGRYPNDRLW